MTELFSLEFHCKSSENIILFQLVSMLQRFRYDIIFYVGSALASPLSVNAEYPNNATIKSKTQILA